MRHMLIRPLALLLGIVTLGLLSACVAVPASTPPPRSTGIVGLADRGLVRFPHPDPASRPVAA